MKVVGVCGSPKKRGSNTLYSLNRAMEPVQEAGFDTEVIELSKYNFSGCTACDACKRTGVCSIDDDFTNKIYPILDREDIKGFIFASPVYFGGITSQMKAFIDRCVIFRRAGFKWENRVAGAITVGNSRNGGQEISTFDILAFALIHGMVVVPDSSKTSHFGGNLVSGVEGGIESDSIGIETAVNLGKKVSFITKKVHG